jgi:hypothetical protein
MAGGIYLVGDDDLLIEMTESSYDSEAVLQELLAKYPNLLAGEQMDSEAPRRWLLVSREMGLPSDEFESGRWSVDHLFLDQEGIPTLVEVKRSSDTRLRREVVGQLLEYAANAVVYWPIDRIMEAYKAECESRGADSEDELLRHMDAADEAASFWESVQTNLQAGRIRLVFVADVIPRELRRIVEFLNEQMSPAEVFAVEVKQFAGGGSQALVPRLVGASERKKVAAATQKRKHWTEETFFENLAEHNEAGIVQAVRGLLQGLLNMEDVRIWWGQGVTTASFVPCLGEGSNWLGFFRVVARGGRIETYFAQMRKRSPFDSPKKRMQLLEKFNELPGVELQQDGIDKYPSFSLSVIESEEALTKLLSICRWIAKEFISS